MAGLTHINARGEAHMVDTGEKDITRRVAVAAGEVRMAPATLQTIVQGNAKKGDVLGTARLAGIMAAKETPRIIPLCHPLMLDSVTVELTPEAETSRILIEATVRCTGRTGVEMEALTAVSASALTIYDMCKAVDKDMTIGNVRLIEKSGGRSGHYRRGQ